MSLINDALKRASQTEKNKGQARQAPTNAPMQAVETTARRSKLPLILGIVSSLALAAAAGFYIWHGTKQNEPKVVALKPALPHETKKPTPSPVPSTQVSAPAAAAVVKSQVPKVSVPKVEKGAIPAVPKVSVPVRADSTPVPATPVAIQKAQAQAVSANPPPPAVAPFPDLRIKAILFRTKDPLAIINTKTLGVGDTIEGARVVKIQRKIVTIEFHGEVRDLPMD